MPSRREFDHIGAYNFHVEVDGVNLGTFKRVTGLSGEIEAIEFQDGDDLVVRKRPGVARFGDVTLEKGFVSTPHLLEWWESIRDGNYDRRNMSIVLHDNVGGEICRWNCFECWPRSWKLGPLEGGANELLYEAVTVAIEYVERG